MADETTATYYVYRHIRLDTMQPFYIGKGKGRRPHDKSGRSVYWNGIVNKHGYRVDILLETRLEEEAYEKEKEFIRIYGMSKNGGLLCNFNEGGYGVKGEINKGIKRPDLSERNKKGNSEETRRRISESKKGFISPLRGLKHSMEHRLKNSKARLGKPVWNTGKKGKCHQLGNKKENHWNWGNVAHNRRPFTAISPKGKKHTFQSKIDMIKKYKDLEKSDGNITSCLKNPTTRTCKGWSQFTYL
jgi:hypothetical protein